MEVAERLTELKKSIESSKEPKTETIRTILSWFGYQRRGTQVLTQMERTFVEHGLQTTPELSEPWIDGIVSISLAQAGEQEAPRYEALIARLGHLDAANQTPVSIKRDQKIDAATALMLRHDFSQIPVMRNERDIDGVISWRTIGEAIALGGTPEFVRECMETKVRILKPDIPLTDAIDEIVRNEFVMVRSKDNLILGPVTTTDLAGRYHALAEPFLLISQIESSIRRILDAHASVAALKAAKFGDDDRDVKRPEDLTFSEYKTALSNDAVWQKLGLKLDKSEVLAIIEEVRVARNDIMHFHPDDNGEGTVGVLRNAAQALEKIAKATVPRCAIR